MVNKNKQTEFVAYIVELMQSVGPVTSKRMFGGYGIFLEGLMFGLVSDTTLYLKADDGNRQSFLDQGLEPFIYNKQGKDVALSYFQCPEEALELPEVMNSWANSAYSAALRAAANKRKK